MEVTEKVSIDDLLDIDNNVLSNILKIFSTLNSEVLYLKNHVKVKLFNAILYYEECGKPKHKYSTYIIIKSIYFNFSNVDLI